MPIIEDAEKKRASYIRDPGGRFSGTGERVPVGGHLSQTDKVDIRQTRQEMRTKTKDTQQQKLKAELEALKRKQNSEQAHPVERAEAKRTKTELRAALKESEARQAQRNERVRDARQTRMDRRDKRS